MTDSIIYQQLGLVSYFGDSPILIAFTTLIIYVFLLRKLYKLQANVFLITLLSFPYSLLLKGIFRQPRPETAEGLLDFAFNLYSFPSGHVVFYVAYWGYLFYLSYQLTKIDIYLRRFVRVISVYFILLVGISRVFLGMHFAIDTIAGYIFGGIFLSLTIYIYKSLSKNNNQN